MKYEGPRCHDWDSYWLLHSHLWIKYWLSHNQQWNIKVQCSMIGIQYWLLHSNLWIEYWLFHNQLWNMKVQRDLIGIEYWMFHNHLGLIDCSIITYENYPMFKVTCLEIVGSGIVTIATFHKIIWYLSANSWMGIMNTRIIMLKLSLDSTKTKLWTM